MTTDQADVERCPITSSALALYPLPVSFLFSDPANLRLNSSSAIAGEANAGSGDANDASVTINSGT